MLESGVRREQLSLELLRKIIHFGNGARVNKVYHPLSEFDAPQRRSYVQIARETPPSREINPRQPLTVPPQEAKQ